jgi:hypothetical protein
MKRRSDDIAKVLGMACEWKPLEALGPYYGKSWFVTRPGEGAFSQVLNRMPEQAAKAKKRPMPPNLETYAAALTRDKIDESTVVEWSPLFFNACILRYYLSKPLTSLSCPLNAVFPCLKMLDTFAFDCF